MRTALPHGAKGIQGEGFAVAFADDKIVFTLKPRLDDDPDGEATEKHYTVQAGQNSGVIDISRNALVPGWPQGTSDVVRAAGGRPPAGFASAFISAARDDRLDTPVADRVDEAP